MPEQCNHENGCSCHTAGGPMPPQPQSFAPPPPYQAPGSQMPMPPMPRMPQMPTWAAAAVNRPSMRRGWRIGIATVVVAELIAAAVFITAQLTDDDDNSTSARTVGSVAATNNGAGAATVD